MQMNIKIAYGYTLNDYIGKTGIEYVCEKYLKGTDGKKQTDMSVDGTITGEYVTEVATQGNDVILTKIGRASCRERV